MEVPELLNLLESNQPQVVEDIKSKLHENFNATKESWLINGIFDIYLATNSYRIVDVLVGVREPHDRYLFDRLAESLKGSQKLQALTLLGHIVRKQPTWLYKIAQHTLMKDLLKLLKTEVDILPLMSALLVIIVLLPMIPALIGPHLQDIFDVFSRLAAWNTNNPNKLPEEHLLHLQIGLCALFNRLYAMYPCNFLGYLRDEYSVRENLGIFSHTIKPMIDTVRMHPLLVTASKDVETATSRWMKMEHHDVIVECAKFALDSVEKPREDIQSHSLSSFRSRSNLECSGPDSPHQMKSSHIVSPSSYFLSEKEFWSPSVACGIATPPPADSNAASIPQTPNSLNYGIMSPLHHEGTSPPEAAVEATPETTPIKDVRPTSVRPLINSGVARALNTLGKWPQPPSGGQTPSHSQPSSPMKKEPSPFRFPEGSAANNSSSIPTERRDSLISQKIFRVRLEQIEASSQSSSVPLTQHATSGTNGASSIPQMKVVYPRAVIGQSPDPAKQVPPPIFHMDGVPSPQISSRRIGASDSKETFISAPEVAATQIPTIDSCKEKTQFFVEKNGFQTDDVIQDMNQSQEEQEIPEIVRQEDQLSIDSSTKGLLIGRQRDSALEEFHPSSVGFDRGVFDLDDEVCQINAGSPCFTGGLHMPNSASMLEFARRVSRIRNSHCDGVTELFSLPPSGMGSRRESRELQSDCDAPSGYWGVRRTNSCPEMKKCPSSLTGDVAAALEEEEEDEATSKDSKTGEGEKIKIAESPGGNKFRRINSAGGADKSLNSFSHPHPVVNASSPALTETGGRLTTGTQTIDNNCAPLPYEHLFLGILPQVTLPSEIEAESHASGDVPFSFQALKSRNSPCALLDKYMESLANSLLREEKDGQKVKSQVTETENRILREQLTLWHIRYQFERLCREVHGERNRRLFGKSRTNRALEEHNNALRDQLSLLQKDLENVYNERENFSKEFKIREKQLQDDINFKHNQCAALQRENKILKSKNEVLEQYLQQEKANVEAVTKERQKVECSLFAVKIELNQMLEKASAGEQLRGELEQLQKELVLMGELQQRYRDSFSQQALQKRGEEEISLLQDTFNEELKGMQQSMDAKSANLEATKLRVTELEAIVTRKDMVIADQKRLLKCAKEEYQEQLEAVETKYSALRSINQKLEEQLLELQHQVKRSGTDDGSLGGSVGASGERPGSSRGGFSPHGSPLLVSMGPDGLPVYEGIMEDADMKKPTQEHEWVEEAAGNSSDGDEG